MATQTNNLKLTKFSYSDAADIAAMNENMDIIDEQVSNKSPLIHKHKMQDIEGLSLEAKNVTIEDTSNLFEAPNVEGALKELFINVSDGKSSIAQAITSKGVPASADDSFTTLANKISQIISALLNIPFPNFNVGIGTVSATFDTLDSTFKEFRIQGQAWQTSNIFNNLIGNTNYVFEAKYGGNRVSKLTLVTPKANQTKPIAPTASNITTNSVTVTAPIGYMIRFNGSEFSSPHTFTNLNYNTIYEFYSFIPSTNNLNQSPLSDVLRVQTLNIKKLFDGVDTSLELGIKEKFSTVLMTGASGSIGVSNEIICKLTCKDTGSFTGDNYLTVRSKVNLDLSKFSKLIVNVSRVDKYSSESYGIGFQNKVSTNITEAKKYEIDISSMTSEQFEIQLIGFRANAKLQLNISEIFLA